MLFSHDLPLNARTSICIFEYLLVPGRKKYLPVPGRKKYLLLPARYNLTQAGGVYCHAERQKNNCKII